jgi:cathepsin B
MVVSPYASESSSSSGIVESSPSIHRNQVDRGTWSKQQSTLILNDFRSAEPSLVARIEQVPAFDWRTVQYAGAGVLTEAMNQELCGGCWAFVGANIVSDRIRILTRNAQMRLEPDLPVGRQINFDPTYLINCSNCYLDRFCSDGCAGGYILAALETFVRGAGVPLTTCRQLRAGANGGGEWVAANRDTERCELNGSVSCASEATKQDRRDLCDRYLRICPPLLGSRGAPLNYNGHDTRVSHVYSVNLFDTTRAPMNADQLRANMLNIMCEIYAWGPVGTTFYAHTDFADFFDGHRTRIYMGPNSEATEIGAHAVSIVGWGTEHGVPYWVCRNSWSKRWGDGGYFRIVRGRDVCGIESDVSGALVSTTPEPLDADALRASLRRATQRTIGSYRMNLVVD